MIVCEGTKTEPNYFEGLKKQLPIGVLKNLTIDIDGTGKNTLSIIDETIKIRTRYKRQFNREADEVWAVFDRDSFPAQNFNAAIAKAQSENIFCAWSNEAFELWYLLHFNFYQNAMPRTDYQRLIEREIIKITGNTEYKYQKNAPDMFDLLQKTGNVEQAIIWAKQLDRTWDGQTDYAGQNPCTKAHLLVEKLLKMS